MLDAVLIKRPIAEWLAHFAGEVPAGPVNDMAQALDNPYFRDRGGVQDVNHPDRPDFKMINNPIRMDQPIPARPAPKLGADSEDILSELGYSSDDIAKLRTNNAI
jgi:succinate--hydroxymethylglutarate CoA-transferase